MSRKYCGSMDSLRLRVKRNFTILFSGGAVASLFGFAALTFNARALGPELLGVLALLQAFVAVMSRLFSFENWQAVLKFGAEAKAAGDSSLLRDVVVLGFLYDLTGAVVATIVGIGIVYTGADWFDIEQAYQHYAALFALTLLFGATSSASGLLRLFGRFGLMTSIQVAASFLGALGALVLWLVEATFPLYVIFYSGLIALQACAVLGASLVLWRSLRLPSLCSPINNKAMCKQFWGFSWSTWGVGTLNVLRQNADLFAVTAMLGPAAAGIYKFAAQLASLVSRFGDPMRQVMFPEIATLVASADLVRLRRILVRAFLAGLAFLFVVTIGVIVFGDVAIYVVGGREFSEAYWPLTSLVFAFGLTVAGFFFQPAVVTLIGPGYFLFSTIIGTFFFFPVLYLGLVNFGIAGAALSHIIFGVIWFLLNAVWVARRLNVRLPDIAEAMREFVFFVLKPIRNRV